jgi:predicted nucleic acid-binding protein
MVRLNNLQEVKSIILDTDVIVNWLTQEVETVTGKDIWTAPYKIITKIEEKKLKGFISLTTILEIRFLLRRKKGLSEKEIASVIEDLVKIFEVGIPDEITLLRANRFQTKYPIDPFDAILLSFALTTKPYKLITRDTDFLKIATQFLPTSNPEDFISHL